MSRRHAREAALLTLFQMDFSANEASLHDVSEIAAGAVEGLKEKDLPYAQGLVRGTRAALGEIDAAIARSAKEWKLERMPGVDRNLAWHSTKCIIKRSASIPAPPSMRLWSLQKNTARKTQVVM